MASVSIRDVWKLYGKTAAVKELNLDAQDGEFLCVLGPSGCGKSSTLRMLAGLEQISAGDIYLRRAAGQRSAAQGSRHRDGVRELRPLPAQDGLREHGQPAAAARHRRRDHRAQGREGRRNARDRAAAAAQAGSSSPAARSSAQRSAAPSSASRSCSCSTSRSRISTPSCAPTCAASSRSCSASSARPWSTSPMISSRRCRWPTASPSCTTACCSSSARRSEIYDHPVNEWVAGFVGEPPMNFLDCTLEERGGQLLVVHPAFAVPVTPPQRCGAERRAAARQVRLAMRPAEIAIASPGVDGAVKANILVTEPLGGDMLVDCALADNKVLVKTSPDFAGVRGEECWLSFNTAQVASVRAGYGLGLFLSQSGRRDVIEYDRQGLGQGDTRAAEPRRPTQSLPPDAHDPRVRGAGARRVLGRQHPGLRPPLRRRGSVGRRASACT